MTAGRTRPGLRLQPGSVSWARADDRVEPILHETGALVAFGFDDKHLDVRILIGLDEGRVRVMRVGLGGLDVPTRRPSPVAEAEAEARASWSRTIRRVRRCHLDDVTGRNGQQPRRALVECLRGEVDRGRHLEPVTAGKQREQGGEQFTV